MLYRVGCTLDYDVPEPSVFIFNVAAAQHPSQRIVSESVQLAPPVGYEDLLNLATGTRYTRIEVPAGRFTLQYQAVVERLPLPPISEAPSMQGAGRASPEALPYLFSSRYCQVDLLMDLACDVTGGALPGMPQVSAICDWLYGNIRYLPGTSNSSTSALDTARDRSGVCRDFAHLGIALCRAMGIPARFVTGYAYGLPMPDFHACMEAFVDGAWRLFDPSRQTDIDQMVRICTGNDAAEASFATIFGAGEPSEMCEMAVYAEPATSALDSCR